MSHLLEACAWLLNETGTRRGVPWLVVSALLFAMVLGIGRYGLTGSIVVLVVIGIILLAASDVAHARTSVWQMATRPVQADRSPARLPTVGLHPPTAISLRRLAVAIDAIRHGHAARAHELVPTIPRDLLRADELRLLDAVRAVVTMHLGDEERAARQAVLSLPTGSPDLDQLLGRLVLRQAWSNDDRLRAIDDAWKRAGVRLATDGVLARLRRLISLKQDRASVSEQTPEEAERLAPEADAVGDADLAYELKLVAKRGSGYR